MKRQKSRVIPATDKYCPKKRMKFKSVTRAEVPEWAAAVYGVKVARSTLNKLASIGGGPPFTKRNGTAIYPIRPLDLWLETKKFGPERRGKK